MIASHSGRWALRAALGAMVGTAGCAVVVNPGGTAAGGSGEGSDQSLFPIELEEAGVFHLVPADTQTNALPVVLFDPVTGGPEEAPTSATLRLEAEDVLVDDHDGAATAVGGASVVVRLAAAESEDPCASEVTVGPFYLAVDGGEVTIEEEARELTASGVALVATGRFALCVEVVAGFEADIRIVRLGLSFGQGTAPADEQPAENTPPTADILADPTAGHAPLLVSFDGSRSSDADGQVTEYAWDFGDGDSDSDALVEHEYTAAGTYEVVLTVTDDEGGADQATVVIEVSESPQREIVHRGTLDTPFDPVARAIGDLSGEGRMVGAAVSGDGEVIYLARQTGEDAPTLWRSDRDGTSVTSVSLTEVEFAGEPTVALAVDAAGDTAFLRAGEDGGIYRVQNATATLIYDPVTSTDVPVEQVGALHAGSDGTSLVFQDADQPFELYRLGASGGSPTLVFDPMRLPETDGPGGRYSGHSITEFDVTPEGTVLATVLRRRDDYNPEADWLDVYRVADGAARAVTTTHDAAGEGHTGIADDGTAVYLRDVAMAEGTLGTTGYVVRGSSDENEAETVSTLAMDLVKIAGDGSRLLAGFLPASDVRRSAIVAGDLASALTLPIELSPAGVQASDSLETILDLTPEGVLSAVSPGRIGSVGYPQVTAITVEIDEQTGTLTATATVADADGLADIAAVTAWFTGPGDEYLDLLDPALNPFRRDDGIEVLGRSHAMSADSALPGLYLLTAELPHAELLTDAFRLRVVVRDAGGRGTYADARFVPRPGETLDTDGDGVGD